MERFSIKIAPKHIIFDYLWDKKETNKLFRLVCLFWRSGWDSNPRNLTVQLISSQPRYDHFDTAPRWQRQVRKENYTAWRGKLQMLAEAIPGAA